MDLVAISRITKTVALGSAAVEVTGLSFRKLAHLALEYPELVPLAAGDAADIGKLLVDAPELALTIFSVGLVGPASRRGVRLWRKSDAEMVQDDAQLLASFDQAPFGQQVDALGTILDLTFSGERAVPFLKMLRAALRKPEEVAEPIPSNPGPSPPNT